MKFHTKLLLPLTVILAMVFVVGGAPEAEAKSAPSRTRKASATKRANKSKARRKAKRRRKRARGRLVCKKRNGKKRCRRVAHFSGRAVNRGSFRAEALPKASGEIHLYSVNFREEVKVNIYNPDGSFNESALAALDNGFRCKRTREQRAVDPRLYELLSIIYDHFGKRRIELVSGFRFQRNESSRHYHASAMDIRIPGVSTRKLQRFAASLDGGNMGLGRYPNSGFVHIDMRAPGEKSYRWTDTSGPGTNSRGKRPSRRWRRRRKPNT